MGPLSVSPMGFGTWAWGNQLLWGYQQSMDDELQQVFNLALENGINLFDTADSYGTGKFNGQSEKLLGRFIREFQGSSHFPLIWSKFILVGCIAGVCKFIVTCLIDVNLWCHVIMCIHYHYYVNSKFVPLVSCAFLAKQILM